MTARTTTASFLLAGLLAAGAVQAQTAPVAGTSNLPLASGEASTMVNGQMNVNPNEPRLNKSKEEIRAEKQMKRAERAERRQMAVSSQMGANAGAPAEQPLTVPAGTPSPKAGGTPK